MILLQMFWAFFKVGLFSIGGGLATLPFLYEMSDKYQWFSYADIADMIAISESTPGALGINMATYAGYLTSGVIGGIIATLGLIAPGLIIIIIISKFLDKFRDNKYVNDALYGLRAASIAMIAAAGVNVIKTALINLSGQSLSEIILIKPIILFILIFIAQKKIKIHPICYIIIAAIVGIIFKF